MKRQVITPIDSNTAESIVQYWKHSPLNSIPAIAKKFNQTEAVVSRAINKHLETCLPQNH